MNIYFSDQVGDPSVPGNPFTWTGRNVYQTSSNSYTKELDIYMRHVFVESDDGYILSSVNQYHSL